MDPALHYVVAGATEGRWPHPLFDPDWYRRQLGHASRGRRTPLEHYLSLPVDQRPATHPLFDPDWYRLQNPAVAKAGIDPLEHFIVSGGKEGRSPHPEFDSAWYQARYPDVAVAGVNPLIHYLVFGADEGRDPSPWFDTAWYGETQLGAQCAGENPLVHHAQGGHRDGLKTRPAAEQAFWWDSICRRRDACFRARRTDVAEALAQMAHAPGVSVIIPVYNAPDELEACLAAVARHTPRAARIVVIDDASTDERVRQVLDAHRSDPRLEMLENKENQGYTRTINRGIQHAGRNDVVLLNADTQVGPGWLGRLRLSAYSGERTATATALSNNAGAFSAPEINRENPLPQSISTTAIARAVAQASLRVRPVTPTGNGFCMYVRRACIDEIGEFDEQAFPCGYGEENDFCMRAVQKNWLHIVDDSTYVFHHRSASFGSRRDLLAKQGLAVVNQRYPDYADRVAAFLGSTGLTQARQRVADIVEVLQAEGDTVKPRVLYVIAALHEQGGTWLTNRDLMDALAGDCETMLLRSDGKLLELFSYRAGEFVPLDHAVLAEPIRAFPHASDEYDAIVAQWLHEYTIELVHVRHIALHGLGLLDVANRMWIPVVFSFHDYYTVCPTVKLLDENLVFCGGRCTTTQGHCTPELWPDENVPALKHAAVHGWKRAFSDALEHCDALVTTSQTARQIVLDNHPALAGRLFHIIPHGRDFGHFLPPQPAIAPDEPIRLLVPGNLTLAKGAGIVRELARCAIDGNYEIHLLGRWLDGVPPKNVIFHGPYARNEFLARVEEIRPHAGAVLSIWPETWCHTLTELWAAGLPVIGYDLGAVAERIRACGGGWVLTCPTSQAVRDLIRDIVREPEQWSRAARSVRMWQKKVQTDGSCHNMAREYSRCYGELALAMSDTEAGKRQ